MSGILYGLGVGPGDPELLTLKAHRILTAAKIVAYPAPDSGESFARSIVAGYLSEAQREIPIVIPMRGTRFPAKAVYDEAAETIGNALADGEDVAVLCEGDPFFYGSFMYLFERLSGHYPVEIVPGVSSLTASAAALQRPIAARNDVLSVIPAPLGDEAIAARLEQADAAALIKLGRHFPRVRELIAAMGLTRHAGYLERVTLDNQRVMPLGAAGNGTAPYFSMILIYKGAENWVLDQTVPIVQPISGEAGR